MTQNEYLKVLEEADPRNGETFRSLLNEGMKLMRLTNEHFARMFGVSRPSIIRWRNGSTMPHNIVCKLVFKTLKEHMEKILKGKEISNFENRYKFKTWEEVLATYKQPTNVIQHILKNDDETFSIMTHIVCNTCNYCRNESYVYKKGIRFDTDYPLVHMAVEDLYVYEYELEEF